MGLTAFPNGISSFGVPVFGGGIPVTYGNYYWVDYDNGLDSNDGTTRDTAFKTISKANDTVVTNNNDVVLLSANSAHSFTSMLTISKNRVHFVGLDGGRRRVDPRTRIQLTGSTGATNVAALKVTGMGCSFTNMKIINANTVTESLYGVVAAGEDTVWQNCTISMNATQSSANIADLLLQSCNDRFIDCSIGNAALVRSGASTNVLCDDSKVALAAAQNCRFDDCEFVHWGSAATITKVNVAANNDVYDNVTFKNCEFRAKIAEGTIASAVVANTPASTFNSGSLIFINPAFHNIDGICADSADNLGCWVIGPASSSLGGLAILGVTTPA
jgi:hypothetical protein